MKKELTGKNHHYISCLSAILNNHSNVHEIIMSIELIKNTTRMYVFRIQKFLEAARLINTSPSRNVSVDLSKV